MIIGSRPTAKRVPGCSKGGLRAPPVSDGTAGGGEALWLSVRELRPFAPRPGGWQSRYSCRAEASSAESITAAVVGSPPEPLRVSATGVAVNARGRSPRRARPAGPSTGHRRGGYCAAKKDLTAKKQNGGTRVASYASETALAPPSVAPCTTAAAATSCFASANCPLRLPYGSPVKLVDSRSSTLNVADGTARAIQYSCINWVLSQ